MTSRKPVMILYADDDVDDRMLAADALADAGVDCRLETVSDGVELLEYLRGQGAYADPDAAPRPALVLLDLNMPRMDGASALREIKADPALRHIPVVIMTTSSAASDVARGYDLGASSYIVKPASFDRLVEILGELARYWFEVVQLPEEAA